MTSEPHTVQSLTERLLADAELQSRLAQAQTPDACASALTTALARHGVTVDAQQLAQAIRDHAVEQGPLSDDQLETVSGGFENVIVTIMPILSRPQLVGSWVTGPGLGLRGS
ncbi:hypothetical protein IMZ29_01795 [Achromobacter sp. GG226]|uniref:hypothetical protein n=1 Tax=Verticiella alkaliphila TaxID=2779529 RepID=UPI001C0D1934|nr:hypothetical protein [Verticiella sp. GG226]MBU4609326.1 hypothetical protein [Verticiella sp. GG226]